MCKPHNNVTELQLIHTFMYYNDYLLLLEGTLVMPSSLFSTSRNWINQNPLQLFSCKELNWVNFYSYGVHTRHPVVVLGNQQSWVLRIAGFPKPQQDVWCGLRSYIFPAWHRNVCCRHDIGMSAVDTANYLPLFGKVRLQPVGNYRRVLLSAQGLGTIECGGWALDAYSDYLGM